MHHRTDLGGADRRRPQRELVGYHCHREAECCDGICKNNEPEGFVGAAVTTLSHARAAARNAGAAYPRNFMNFISLRGDEGYPYLCDALKCIGTPSSVHVLIFGQMRHRTDK